MVKKFLLFFVGFVTLITVNSYILRRQKKWSKYHDRFWDRVNRMTLFKHFLLSLFFSVGIASSMFALAKLMASPTSSVALDVISLYLVSLVVLTVWLFAILLLIVHVLTVQNCRERMKECYRRRGKTDRNVIDYWQR